MACRLSSCGARALGAPRYVRSSRTRARTCVPCIGRRILDHCATRETQEKKQDSDPKGRSGSTSWEVQKKLPVTLHDPELAIFFSASRLPYTSYPHRKITCLELEIFPFSLFVHVTFLFRRIICVELEFFPFSILYM